MTTTMYPTLGSAAFAPGSPGHAGVVFATIVGLCAVLGAARAYESGAPDGAGRAARRGRFTVGLAAALGSVWLADLVQDAWPARATWATALPLHLCDLAGLVAPLALLTGRPALRAVLHFWALVFSTMAFVAPVVRTGPADVGWWVYWLTHAGIVAAAAYDVAVLGYRPRWADFRLAAGVTVVYAAFMAPLDGWLNANYGYVGDTARARDSLVAAFGPWPARVPLLAMTAVGMMAVLTLPWELAFRLAALQFDAADESPLQPALTATATAAPAATLSSAILAFPSAYEDDADAAETPTAAARPPEPAARAA